MCQDIREQINRIKQLQKILSEELYHGTPDSRQKELVENIYQRFNYRFVSEDEFDDAVYELNTLDLEDDQVSYPRNENKSYLMGGNNYDLYVLNKSDLPDRGPFLLSIETNDESDMMGFIRGTKFNQVISFNMIHMKPEYRGEGVGTDIYEKFLNNGFIIKSDDELTDSTYSIYTSLVKRYRPIIFEDETVGLVK